MAASLLGAMLWWSSLPAREEPRELRIRRPAIAALEAAADSMPRGRERLRSRDAMKLVLLSCFKSQ